MATNMITANVTITDEHSNPRSAAIRVHREAATDQIAAAVREFEYALRTLIINEK